MLLYQRIRGTKLPAVFTFDGAAFEREVADLYRALGADVQADVPLAGNRIDIVVTERTPSGASQRRIVECKAYSRPVPRQPVMQLFALSNLLRSRGMADAATLVASNGFTASARETASQLGIDLLEVSDLRARVDERSSVRAPVGPPPTVEPPREVVPVAFVAMPFTPRFDDVYLYGISSAAERAGMLVERVDDGLDSEEVIADIKRRIQNSSMVIVDTTEPNANVFYELGYADGLGKRVILIANAEADLPFDLRGRRHLLYRNIKDLEDRLVEFLRHEP